MDGNLQIRAILAVPDANGLRFAAAIAPRGSNKARHVSWRAGSDSLAGGAEVHACATDMGSHIAYGISVAECDEPIEHLLGRRPRRIRRLLREIEAVALLAVTQLRSTVDAGEGAALADLPYVGLSDPRRTTGNRKKAERENSLFRIKRLPHLRGVTVIAEATQAYRVSSDADVGSVFGIVNVRPFYRMQSYGPRHSLRRLIWVPAHSRRVRDDGRVEMIVVPRPPDD